MPFGVQYTTTHHVEFDGFNSVVQAFLVGVCVGVCLMVSFKRF